MLVNLVRLLAYMLFYTLLLAKAIKKESNL